MSAQAMLKEAEAHSFSEGVESWLKSIFKAPAGQYFLKTLHESWMESYQKSTKFLSSVGRFRTLLCGARL